MDGLTRFRFANDPESLAAWASASNTFGPVRKAVDTAAVEPALSAAKGKAAVEPALSATQGTAAVNDAA